MQRDARETAALRSFLERVRLLASPVRGIKLAVREPKLWCDHLSGRDGAPGFARSGSRPLGLPGVSRCNLEMTAETAREVRDVLEADFVGDFRHSAAALG